VTHYDQIKQMLEATDPLPRYTRFVDLPGDEPTRFILIGGVALPDFEEVCFAFNSDGTLYNIHASERKPERMPEHAAAPMPAIVQ
jgi:hypothetical protein